jgi:hypothetical protein
LFEGFVHFRTVLGWKEELLSLQVACGESDAATTLPGSVHDTDGECENTLALDEDAGEELTSEALATIVHTYTGASVDSDDDWAALAPQDLTTPPPGYIADILETGRLALERNDEASEKDRAAIAVDAALDATDDDHDAAILTGRRGILEDALELFPVVIAPTVRIVAADKPETSSVTVALGDDEIPYGSD